MNLEESKNRVSLFIILWCIASIFHSISFVTLENGISNPEIIRITVLFLSLGQLIYSKGYYFFLLALFLSTSIVIILPGSVPNHIFFEGLINITILGFSIIYLIKYFSENLSIEDILSRIDTVITPFIRVSVIILYFFVVLHKLNFDFFNPYESCSGEFFSRILEDFNLTSIGFIDEFHTNNFVLLRNFSIYFALISEAIIPILLIVKRFRNFGVVYGIFFHIILALHFHGGIYSFSVMILVYYTCFFNKQLTAKFLQYFKNQSLKYFVIGSLMIISLLYILILNDADTLFFRSTTKLLFIGLIFFLIYSIWYLVLFIKTIRLVKMGTYENSKLSFRLHFSTAFMVVFLCFVGLSPYLGLRTEVCFSMFSNLQTESNLNNHFFMSSKLRIFPYQDELVSIKATNIVYLDSYVNDQNKKLVPFEFNRIVNANNNFYIDYVYKEKITRVEKKQGKLSGDVIPVYTNYFLNKFMSFRPVLMNNKCQH